MQPLQRRERAGRDPKQRARWPAPARTRAELAPALSAQHSSASASGRRAARASARATSRRSRVVRLAARRHAASARGGDGADALALRAGAHVAPGPRGRVRARRRRHATVAAAARKEVQHYRARAPRGQHRSAPRVKHAPQHHGGFQFWKVHRVCKIVQDTSDVL